MKREMLDSISFRESPNACNRFAVHSVRRGVALGLQDT
jgi:hypothetical protein